MCFHRGVLCLGKCNRLEYQWDVPESVTAHLLSDCGCGPVSGGRGWGFLWTPPAVPCFPANILTLNKSRRRPAPALKTLLVLPRGINEANCLFQRLLWEVGRQCSSDMWPTREKYAKRGLTQENLTKQRDNGKKPSHVRKYEPVQPWQDALSWYEWLTIMKMVK